MTDYNPDDQVETFGFSEQATSESTRKLLPPADYRAYVANVQKKTTRAGDSMWSVELHVMEPEQFAGAKLYDNLVWVRKAENILMRKLKAIGFAVQPGARIDVRPSQLMNRRVVVRVKHREYQGEKQNNITDWMPDSGPQQQQQPQPPQQQQHSQGTPSSAPPPQNQPPVGDQGVGGTIPF